MKREYAMDSHKADLNILVVDDEEILRDAIADCALEAGFQVSKAADGADALNQLESQVIHGIITDMHMPNMNGLELLEVALKARPELKGIILTGDADKDTAIKAIKLGIHDFLEKPVSAEKLEVVLANFYKTLQLEIQNKELIKKMMVNSSF